SRLGDGDHDDVLHVGSQPVRRELRRLGRMDLHRRLEPLERDAEKPRDALRGDRGGALADEDDLADATLAQTGDELDGQDVLTEEVAHRSVRSRLELASKRLADAVDGLGDLLDEEVRIRAAVDVARRDLRVTLTRFGDGSEVAFDKDFDRERARPGPNAADIRGTQ